MKRTKSLAAKRPRAPRGGFALLEVLVALVILGIAVAALMRSFTISMSAVRKNDITAQASVLAETLMQSVEVDPAALEDASGNFSEMGERFAKYSYDLKVSEEELEYRHRGKQKYDDLRTMKHVDLTITYFDETRMREPMVALAIQTYMMPIERFSQRAKFENELFLEDPAASGVRR